MKVLAVCLLLSAVMTQTGDAAKHREFFRSRCPSGWWKFKGRCFHYVSKPMSWAEAETNCRTMKATLASAHSIDEYHKIQQVIMASSHDYRETWIGGSDAQQEKLWLWTDGSAFDYSYWCSGEPNNGYWRNQHCIQMNYSVKKCWDDQVCSTKLPSVCVKKLWWSSL